MFNPSYKFGLILMFNIGQNSDLIKLYYYYYLWLRIDLSPLGCYKFNLQTFSQSNRKGIDIMLPFGKNQISSKRKLIDGVV